DRLAICFRVENVPALAVAYMQMNHRRTRAKASRCGLGQFSRRLRQCRMVRLGAPPAIGGNSDGHRTGSGLRHKGILHSLQAMQHLLHIGKLRSTLPPWTVPRSQKKSFVRSTRFRDSLERRLATSWKTRATW